MMRLRAGSCVLALGLVLVLGACGDTEDDATPAVEAVTESLTAEQQRARRDTAIAGSRLPGAAGVGRAMDAAEAARVRAEATDTMLD